MKNLTKKVSKNFVGFLGAAENTLLTMQKTSMAVASAGVMAGCLICNNIAFAANGAAGLIQQILELVALLIIVLGIVVAVLGIVHYAAAYSEGDGPAKNKAVQQIAAGGMVILMSALLKNKAGDFAGYIVEN